MTKALFKTLDAASKNPCYSPALGHTSHTLVSSIPLFKQLKSVECHNWPECFTLLRPMSSLILGSCEQPSEVENYDQSNLVEHCPYSVSTSLCDAHLKSCIIFSLHCVGELGQWAGLAVFLIRCYGTAQASIPLRFTRDTPEGIHPDISFHFEKASHSEL